MTRISDMNPQEINALGLKYLRGEGVEKDINIAFNYFCDSARNGYLRAKYNMALCYIDKDFKDRDVVKAFELVCEVATQGDCDALFLLSQFYRLGIGTDIDEGKEKLYLQDSADKGNVQACIRLGDKALCSSPKEIEKSIHYYTLASEKNNTLATVSLIFTLLENKKNEIYLDDIEVLIDKAYNQNKLLGGYRENFYYQIKEFEDYANKNLKRKTPFTILEDGTFLKKVSTEATGVIKVPDSVHTIGAYAFSGCDGIKKIILPNSLVSIGHGAFSFCM